MGNEPPDASKPEVLSPSENSKSREKKEIVFSKRTFIKNLDNIGLISTDTNLHLQSSSFYFCPLIFHLASAGRRIFSLFINYI